MAYGADIDALGNSHRYILSVDADDSVGTNHGTNNTGLFTGAAICQDVTNSYTTTIVTDRVVLPSITTINSSSSSRKAIGGWFMTDSIQTPPRRIYGEGNITDNFHFIYAFGNNCALEIKGTGIDIQVAGPVLVANRPYHLMATFEGNGFNNEVKFYVDGVEQLDSVGGTPDTAALINRTQGIFGDPNITVGFGGSTLALTAPDKGFYNQWAHWNDVTLTQSQIREELFEKGCLENVAIASGTQSAMQTSIDAQASIVGTNVPLDISVAAVTGDGALTLTLDNRTFDDNTSIHVQYLGTGVLTIVNTNGSNASIGSTPNGGTIVFGTEVEINITCKDASTGALIEGARVYLLDNSDALILNGLTNSSGVANVTYTYISDEVLSTKSKTRKGSSSPYYKTSPIAGTVLSSGLDTTILMIKDE